MAADATTGVAVNADTGTDVGLPRLDTGADATTVVPADPIFERRCCLCCCFAAADSGADDEAFRLTAVATAGGSPVVVVAVVVVVVVVGTALAPLAPLAPLVVSNAIILAMISEARLRTVELLSLAANFLTIRPIRPTCTISTVIGMDFSTSSRSVSSESASGSWRAFLSHVLSTSHPPLVINIDNMALSSVLRIGCSSTSRRGMVDSSRIICTSLRACNDDSSAPPLLKSGLTTLIIHSWLVRPAIFSGYAGKRGLPFIFE